MRILDRLNQLLPASAVGDIALLGEKELIEFQREFIAMYQFDPGYDNIRRGQVQYRGLRIMIVTKPAHCEIVRGIIKDEDPNVRSA